MSMEETILSLQVGKNVLNLLLFICRPVFKNQAVITSLLILMATDALITGFLLYLWFTGWPVSLGLERVSLRFLCFQNETYHCVALLLPWVCIGEEWCRSRLFRLRDVPAAEQSLTMQASLLSLACWMIAASYGSRVFGGLCMQATGCDSWEWSCLFFCLSPTGRLGYLLLPCIGAVFGVTITCSNVAPWDTISDTVWCRKRLSCMLLKPLLFGVGAAIFIWIVPAFLGVNSWTALAMDIVCSIFRTQEPDPLSIVECEENQTHTCKPGHSETKRMDRMHITQKESKVPRGGRGRIKISEAVEKQCARERGRDNVEESLRGEKELQIS